MSKYDSIKDAFISGITVSVALIIVWMVLMVFSSCATTHTTQAQGRTVVITTDTTVINHGGSFTVKTVR